MQGAGEEEREKGEKKMKSHSQRRLREANRGLCRFLTRGHYMWEFLSALVDVGGDPCSGQESVHQFLLPSSVPYGSSPHFLSQKRGDPYSKWRPFRDSPSIIVSEPKVGMHCQRFYRFLRYLPVAEEQLVMFEDLDGGGGALSLSRLASSRYLTFSARDDVKAINNTPNPALGWESRFFFAQLLSKRDIWGVPERWVEPFPNPISRSYRWTLIYFQGIAFLWFLSREEFFHWFESVRFVVAEKGKKRALKRVRQSEEGSILVGSDSSAEDASELS
ncbi:hypothetical protein ACLOJK_014574 [Asimina triloba]